MRAAITPRSVAGSLIPPPSATAIQRSPSRRSTCRSIRVRMISSRKNGLPSDLSIICRRKGSGNSDTCRRLFARRSDASGASGLSWISVRRWGKLRCAWKRKLHDPPSTSGRDVTRIMSGRKSVSSVRTVRVSMEAVSAQWMSSTARTAGERASRPSSSARSPTTIWAWSCCGAAAPSPRRPGSSSIPSR